MSYLSNPSEDLGVFANILLDKWFKRAFKEYGNAKRLMLLSMWMAGCWVHHRVVSVSR